MKRHSDISDIEEDPAKAYGKTSDISDTDVKVDEADPRDLVLVNHDLECIYFDNFSFKKQFKY